MTLPTYKPHVTDESPYSLPLFSAEQLKCLNRLIGEAACDKTIEKRLICDRDEAFIKSYHINTTTWQYLKTIEATTLEEFCVAVFKLQNTMVNQ